MLLPTLMTAIETANYLGVSPRTLLRWAKDRVGPPRLRFGKKALYKTEALLLWLEANEASQNTTRRTDGAL